MQKRANNRVLGFTHGKPGTASNGTNKSIQRYLPIVPWNDKGDFDSLFPQKAQAHMLIEHHKMARQESREYCVVCLLH